MFWYYIRDNFKTLIVGAIVAIICIFCLVSFINKDIYNKNQNLEPAIVEQEETIDGTIYDKYIENADAINKQNTENVDFNSKPVANTLTKTLASFNSFMLKRAQELQKENIIITNNGVEYFELLNGNNYVEMEKDLEEYMSKGNVKTALKLYGFAVKDGKVCHQDGINPESYSINTQYPIDVTFASDYSAEVTVPLIKGDTPAVVYDFEKNPGRDYSEMQTATFSFKKEHGHWLIYNIILGGK